VLIAYRRSEAKGPKLILYPLVMAQDFNLLLALCLGAKSGLLRPG